MTKAGFLGPKLNLEGVVAGYVDGEQSGEHVVRFVVNRDEGGPVAVEMRGETVHGVLMDGHRVALIAPENFDTHVLADEKELDYEALLA